MSSSRAAASATPSRRRAPDTSRTAVPLPPRADGSYLLTGVEHYSTGALFADWIGFDPETVKSVRTGLARSESEGQQRMLALHGGGRRDELEIHPDLWAGIGLVRGGAGTALVGSHEEVAERIEEYAALGIEEFILSGHPHLEEAYWFGEGVLPRLQEQNLWQHPIGKRTAPSAQVPFAGTGGPR